MGNARQDAAHNSLNGRDFSFILDLDYNGSLNLVKHLSQINLMDMVALLTDLKTNQLITRVKIPCF